MCFQIVLFNNTIFINLSVHLINQNNVNYLTIVFFKIKNLNCTTILLFYLFNDNYINTCFYIILYDNLKIVGNRYSRQL